MLDSQFTRDDGRCSILNVNEKTIYSLVGIRGIAALWVVLYHIYFFIPAWSVTPWLHSSWLFKSGFRGVDLFFVLSGFVMMRAHFSDFEELSLSSFKYFMLSRIFRVYPVNFAVMLMILLLVLALPGYVTWVRATYGSVTGTNWYDPLSFMQTATLSTRWLAPDYGPWNVVTWSLSVEVFAYAIFPLIAVKLNKTSSQIACLAYAFGTLSIMLILLRIGGSWDGSATHRLGLLRGMGGFVAGASMFRFVYLTPSKGIAPPIIALASIAVIAGLFFFDRAAILMPFAFATLIAALSYQRGLVDAFLRTPLILFLGRVSFSLYLIHVTLLFVLLWLLQSGKLPHSDTEVGAAFLFYFVITLIIAIALYHFVEIPFQRLGRRIVSKITNGGQQRSRRSISTDQSIPHA